MPDGLIALIIIMFVVAGAVMTKRCIEFLLLGSVIGSIVLFAGAADFCGRLSECPDRRRLHEGSLR